jgi:pilus assembly protein Flp/PilA
MPRADFNQERFVMKKLVARFAQDQSGATAIEYGLIAAGISITIILVVQGVGTQLVTTFTKVTTELAKSN